MDKKTKQQRFKQLHLALQYCTDTGGVFSIGQRIMINQERGRLLQYDNPNDFTDKPAPDFIYDTAFDGYLKFIIEKIDNTNWQPLPRTFNNANS